MSTTRLGVDHRYVSAYRQRLLTAGVVAPERALLDYRLPHTRDYLRERLAP
ncbi:MAG: hypothetical protein LBK95_17515 [Bifidobacteriaceae bacterium]|nr:hypothetical protein [Bifidobacteriaceae bacterium]